MYLLVSTIVTLLAFIIAKIKFRKKVFDKIVEKNIFHEELSEGELS